MRNKTAFEADGMTVAFQSAAEVSYVLRELNLRIEQGEFVFVVGRNGSGKSTLLKVMAGLCPISRGRVQTYSWPEVQAVFQNPDAQMIGESVIEEVCFGLENQGMAAEERVRRAEEALEKVRMKHLMHQSVEKLSGGQKQLLCIAGALASDAQLLVLDEPTSMLDPISREQILTVAQTLHKEGRTIVWATQLMEELGYGERVVVLDEGNMAYDGTPERFFYGDDSVSELSPCEQGGFRKPYIVETVEHLLHSGLSLSERPVTIPQFKRVIEDLCPFR
ncbi:energy-coupling factor ABC transporter ATP-binding protein [Marinicrinis lubricantis]|uniref:Energy-coupling factor ABC transporter ATP-binding protein n=1 Tax=Marinicrinis lubricantis TaxID=2086470 RepID=A0ABW1IU81_9BACL